MILKSKINFEINAFLIRNKELREQEISKSNRNNNKNSFAFVLFNVLNYPTLEVPCQ